MNVTTTHSVQELEDIAKAEHPGTYSGIEDSYCLPSKGTLRVPEFLDELSREKSVYPRGIVGMLRESDFDSAKAQRIELFAHNEREKKCYGVLKHLFIAFSSETTLHNLAIASSNVIEVHAIHRNTQKEKLGALTQSKLVLKWSKEKNEIEENYTLSMYANHIPDLIVSTHWLDLMDLSSGDRVIISNPREDYEIPPPLRMKNQPSR